MGVDIEQHLSGAVAEPVLGVFDAGAVFRKLAGMVVPEFMKGDIDAGRFGQALKAFGPTSGVLEFAPLAGMGGRCPGRPRQVGARVIRSVRACSFAKLTNSCLAGYGSKR